MKWQAILVTAPFILLGVIVLWMSLFSNLPIQKNGVIFSFIFVSIISIIAYIRIKKDVS